MVHKSLSVVFLFYIPYKIEGQIMREHTCCSIYLNDHIYGAATLERHDTSMNLILHSTSYKHRDNPAFCM